MLLNPFALTTSVATLYVIHLGTCTPPPPPRPLFREVPLSRGNVFASLFRNFLDPPLKKLQYYTDPHKIILAAAAKQVAIFPSFHRTYYNFPSVVAYCVCLRNQNSQSATCMHICNQYAKMLPAMLFKMPHPL